VFVVVPLASGLALGRADVALRAMIRRRTLSCGQIQKKKERKKKRTVSLFDWGEGLEELGSIAKGEDWCT